MNSELIKELALKSYVTVGDYSYCESVLDPHKFAELIVKECIRIVSPEDSYNDDWFKAKCDSVLKIKQHFGIE